MEYPNQNFQSNNPVQPTRVMRQDWHVTARWGNFFAIVWLVFAGIGILSIFTIGPAIDRLALLGEDAVLDVFLQYKTLLTAVSLVASGIYGVLALFQYRFSQNMRQALQFTDQDALEASWLNFRNLFRWAGIFTIAMIALYFVLIALLGATMAQTVGGEI